MKTPCPFFLPYKPVDQYTVLWYRLDRLVNPLVIVEVKAIYHTHTPGNKQTLDFLDEWQIFCDGIFVGRSDPGWQTIAEGPWVDAYSNKHEAKAEAITYLKDKLADARLETENLIQQLRDFGVSKL